MYNLCMYVRNLKLFAVSKSLRENCCFCWIGPLYRQKIRHKYHIFVRSELALIGQYR